MSESSEKNLEHDTYGIKNKVLELAFYSGSYQIWSQKFMIVFFFMTHLSSYNNTCKTDA